jgi:hypothetical protein
MLTLEWSQGCYGRTVALLSLRNFVGKGITKGGNSYFDVIYNLTDFHAKRIKSKIDKYKINNKYLLL